MATSVVGVMKMGNTVPRMGLETDISGIPGQCATITPHRLPDIPLYSRQPDYVAPCLRGQYMVLHYSAVWSNFSEQWLTSEQF